MLFAFINMPGPQFLVLYLIVSFVVILGCWIWAERTDPTSGLPLPPVPKKPDPYEIAYLRGGENELTRLAILALIDRGYLKMDDATVTSSTTISQVADAPNGRHLSGFGRTVYDFFSSPHKASDIFKSLPDQVETHCAKIKKKNQDRKLLNADDDVSHALMPGLLGGAIILVMGAIKLLAAISKGKSNVGFLLLIGVAALCILVAICKKRRLTTLGQRYLNRLKEDYNWLDTQTPESGAMMLLATSIFGVAVLTGTAHAGFHSMFQQATSIGGGCGGSCGGGGCGGGCGGCGGCGG